MSSALSRGRFLLILGIMGGDGDDPNVHDY
jgi:hypothetical protein